MVIRLGTTGELLPLLLDSGKAGLLIVQDITVPGSDLLLQPGKGVGVT